MRYELLGICLALTALLLLWTLFALVGRMMWGVGRRRIARWSPHEQARSLFALHVGPLLVAFGCVLGILLPAYIAHEPQVTEETISFFLLLPALFCLTVLLLACYRVLIVWKLTNRLLKMWRRGAERVLDAGMEIPIWRIQHPLPLIAVVGVMRPQVFVATHLFEHLSQQELAAVLRHEQWHLTARDNFQRALVDFCRSGFLPGGGALEREWQESVEITADEYAVRHNPQTALDLATALVKLARLFPTGVSVTMPTTVSTVLMEDSSLARRVHRLMQISGAGPRLSQRRIPTLISGSALGLFLLTLLLTRLHPDALRVVHHGIEVIVSYLP